ncbi:MAG TPA: hypothetical protein VFJ66_04765 [Gaiellales bacterium]|jgi:hypothetical protein|nr:hypothetical protein [Gaiellales bacterium]HEX2589261.1 hypothetical protein [Gaiellales bacterium]
MLRVNRAMAWVLIAIGVALLVETAAIRGGSVGYLGGVAFVALGVLRLRAAR